MSNLAQQIREALAVFTRIGSKPALIGGLAVAAHQVIRATRDVDFLVESQAADALHEALLELGYQCIHRSEDAANYRRGDEGLDVLYAHRPIARRLLEQAEMRETPLGQIRIISAEGLIAFKLQAYVNDPRPSRDLDDIRALLNQHRNRLNMANYLMNSSDKTSGQTSTVKTVLVKEAGVSFQPQATTDPIAAWLDLMEVVQALCPVWPPSEKTLNGTHWRL